MQKTISCLLLSLGLLASGCATLTKGTSQAITVNTDPTGATCTLTRDAKTVAIVNPTPGSVPVDKALGNIVVDCKRGGYQDAAGKLASEFQPMTFGNILLGGIIGIAVDAVSGAMGQYPDTVTITMIPLEFATAGERDAFFDRMRATLMREAQEVRDRIGKLCQSSDCERQLAAAQAGTAVKLAEIEQSRMLAKVVPDPAPGGTGQTEETWQ
jgi:hypothetical protein